MPVTKPLFKLAAMVLALAGLAPCLQADNTVYLAVGNTSPFYFGGPNPYQNGDGGEFTALLTDGTTGLPIAVPAGYSANTQQTIADPNYGNQQVTGFETFCVEDQIDFYVGGTYSYTEGLDIQQTGSGVNGPITELTVGVAYLYQQFATGQLANYDYTDPTTRLADAGALQSAIWALQGEPADPNVPLGNSNPFLGLAETQFGSLAAAQQAVTTQTESIYGVQVLELTSNNGQTNNQDQLVYTYVSPDPASTLGLFGFALVALVAVRRRCLVRA